MKSALASLFGLFTISFPASALAHTTYLVTMGEGDAYFIDESKIEQDERGRKRVWIKIVSIKAPQKASDLNYTMELNLIDCSKGTNRIIKFTEYPKEGSPETIGTSWLGESRMEPGTVYEGVQGFVCDGTWRGIDRSKFDPEDLNSTRRFAGEVQELLDSMEE